MTWRKAVTETLTSSPPDKPNASTKILAGSRGRAQSAPKNLPRDLRIRWNQTAQQVQRLHQRPQPLSRCMEHGLRRLRTGSGFTEVSLPPAPRATRWRRSAHIVRKHHTTLTIMVCALLRRMASLGCHTSTRKETNDHADYLRDSGICRSAALPCTRPSIAPQSIALRPPASASPTSETPMQQAAYPHVA